MNDVLFAVLKALTVATSIGLILSPIPTYIRIIKTKTTGDFSILPVAAIFFSCFVWVIYGCLVGNFVPVVLVDSCGSSLALVFMVIYYRYTSDRSFVHKLWAIAGSGAVIVAIYVAIAVEGVTNQSRDQIETILGFIAAGLDICMYSSPLATIRHVIATKDASSMPLAMSIAGLVNTVLWVAISTDDLFLAIPNGIASGISVVAIILFFIYRPGKYTTAQVEDVHQLSISIKSNEKAGYGEVQSPVVS